MDHAGRVGNLGKAVQSGTSLELMGQLLEQAISRDCRALWMAVAPAGSSWAKPPTSRATVAASSGPPSNRPAGPAGAGRARRARRAGELGWAGLAPSAAPEHPAAPPHSPVWTGSRRSPLPGTFRGRRPWHARSGPRLGLASHGGGAIAWPRSRSFSASGCPSRSGRRAFPRPSTSRPCRTPHGRLRRFPPAG